MLWVQEDGLFCFKVAARTVMQESDGKLARRSRF
jgi:hypothetical protein